VLTAHMAKPVRDGRHAAASGAGPEYSPTIWSRSRPRPVTSHTSATENGKPASRLQMLADGGAIGIGVLDHVSEVLARAETDMINLWRKDFGIDAAQPSPK
jgi:hypothetical protein